MGVYDFDLEAFVALARKLGGDTERVEVKSAAGGVPKGLAETLSSFSNTSGGTVVLGLSEKAGFKPAAGFDARAVADGLAQMCGEKLEPPVRASIDVVEFEGAPVVVATIPELPASLKPCYVKARGLYQGTYVRVGDGDRRVSPYEVDRLLEGRHEAQNDRAVVSESTASDFDDELVERFLARLRRVHPRAFRGMADEELLRAMGAMGADEEGALHPTVAGLLALGRYPQQYLTRAHVSFTVYPGRSKGEVTDENLRFLDSREIVGSIPVMISETMVALRRNMRVSSRVEGAFRVDTPDYPEDAIREAVANALIHRDYSPEGCASQVQVNMYDDRIEVMSPGGLSPAMTVDRLGELGVSEPRNPVLAKMLGEVEYASGYAEQGTVVENKGTGYFHMRQVMRKAGHPDPVPQDHLLVFVLNLYKKGAESEARWAAAGGLPEGDRQQARERKLLERYRDPDPARRIVRTVTEWPEGADRPITMHIVAPGTVDCDIIEFLEEAEMPVGSQRLIEALGKSKATVSRALNRLMNEGLIERLGPGRGPGVVYRLSEGVARPADIV